MKKALIAILGVYFLIGVFFSPLGALTHVVLQKAGEQEVRDRVESVNTAIIGADEQLYVCVTGLLDQVPTDYWIRADVQRMASDPEGLDAEAGYRNMKFMPLWYIPRRNLSKGECSQPPVAAERSLKISSVDVDDTAYEVEWALRDAFAEADDAELVYEVRVADKREFPVSLIAYANKSMLFDDQHAVSFQSNHYYRHGSRLWLLVLPFAWIADVTLWPIELMMWINYGSAH